MGGGASAGGGGEPTRALAVALSLIRQPATFRVVRGLVARRSLSEIARSSGVRYKYAQRVVARLVREGLAIKVRALGRLVVLPTPLLKEAHDLALRELYLRARSGATDPERYGLSLEELERLVKVRKREEAS